MLGVKVFWFITVFGFLFTLLIIQIQLPENVIIGIDENGKVNAAMNRNIFFYTALIIMVISNFFLMILGNLMPFSHQWLPIPNKKQWLASDFTRKQFYVNLKEWIRGLSSVLNMFCSFVILAIFSFNFENFVWLDWTFYLVIIASISWIVYFFILFGKVPTR